MSAATGPGLTSREAARRLAEVGPNTLGTVKAPPWPVILLRQFTGLLVVILIVAAVIAAALGEGIDAIAIGLVVLLNGGLGFVQEWRAENALEALRSMLAQHARVLRDGREQRIDTREIVPGDVVRLSAGDKVPADLALTGAVELRVEESALTGESLPVSKAAPGTPDDTETRLFMGTAVVAGHAEGTVVATGRATAFGEIAELTTSVGEKTTHLQAVLATLARQLAVAAVVLAGVILVAGLTTGHGLHEMFLVALSLAVAIVPEGLPAVVTITLALGAAAMVRKKALARRLQAVETLGAASVICTDKTGTLTEDKMTATRIVTPRARYRVTGGGYDPAGHIETETGAATGTGTEPGTGAGTEAGTGAGAGARTGAACAVAAGETGVRRTEAGGTGAGGTGAGGDRQAGTRVRAETDADLAALLETVLACNRAHLERVDDDGPDGGWRMVGTPTEGALVTLAYKGWCPLPAREPLAELPFTSERKRMSVLAPGEGADAGAWVLHVKGAPERILERCTAYRRDGADHPITRADVERFAADWSALAAEGARVIAVARRRLDAPTPPADEQALTWLGAVALMDPPRDEVRPAIAAATRAGIRVIMITGDGAATARAVADMVGLSVDRVLTGQDVEELSDADLDQALDGDVLFARTAPAHKMRLVKRLQARGQIVAMTGDGVNDAPALKQSDIGIAMGIRGTDVARDASDLVLLDDNFATIVRAIQEGRRQYENLRKFVRYLLSSNAGEVVALLANILTGGPLIFLATQILWMNLITDGVTAVALGLEKTTPGTMDRPPRARTESVIGRAGFAMILVVGAYTGGASLWIFSRVLETGDATLARTAAFTAMVLFEEVAVFAFRSFHHTNFRIGWLSNPLLIGALVAMLGLQLAAVYWPPLQLLLKTAPLGWAEWQLLGLSALPLLVLPELAKALWPARTPDPAG